MNLFTKNNLKYDYKKDKVQVTNELEFKASVYTAPKDTLRNYKIGDDVFRIHSNVGYQAFNNGTIRSTLSSRPSSSPTTKRTSASNRPHS